MYLEIKPLINVDDLVLIKVTAWMYNWWGKEDGYSFDEIKCFMRHSMQKSKLPKTYGLFKDKEIIGMYQFSYEDLDCRPDIYPWLSNIYIDEEYRHQGYARKLLESVKENALKDVPFNEVFLYTKEIHFYEKFGFEFVSEIETFDAKNPLQRLYKLKLK